jgi:NADPH:quinone reductase-like Zn-dependent oxidoreductase
VATRGDELVVEVVAAALHPRIRSQADGSHYTSNGELPLVPGIDAVVRDSAGQLRYALLDDTTFGTMAERTIIEDSRSVILPDHIDPIAIAAAMNPVMSSWVALGRRIDFQRGSRVLVLGATGSAGRMAIQVANRFGAAEVIGAGRNLDRLAELGRIGATRTLTLDQLEQASDVDVVVDYLWGEPTVAAMLSMLPARSDRRAPLSWIEIGSVAGLEAAIPAAVLRAARLQLVGSGIGSVSGAEFVSELPHIARALADGAFDVRARRMPLAEVESAWNAASDGERLVFVP